MRMYGKVLISLFLLSINDNNQFLSAYFLFRTRRVNDCPVGTCIVGD